MTLARSLPLLAIAALLSLAACGGGGGGGEPVAAVEPTPPVPETPAPDPEPEAQPTPPTPGTPMAQTPDPELETPAPDPDAAARRVALQAGQELAKAAADGTLPLPNEHGLRSEAIEIASGAYTDRGAFRFSCTGSEACAVAVDAESGQARATAGNVRLARLPAPEMPVVETPTPETPTPAPETPVAEMPTPEMPAPGIDWPAWMVMDVARAASLLGGSVLDWGEDKVRAEFYRRFTGHQEGNYYRFGEGIGTDTAGRGDNTLVVYDRDGDLDYSEEEYSVLDDHAVLPNFHLSSTYGMGGRCRFENSIDTCGSDGQDPDTKDKIQYQSAAHSWGNIPIVQARTVNPRQRENHDQFLAVVGGLLEYSHFWVTEQKTIHSGYHIGHGAFYELYDPTPYPRQDEPVKATWLGSLVGVGHNPAYRDIYRSPIGGKVTVTSDFTTRVNSVGNTEVSTLNVDIVFSDLKNLDNGNNISLSKESWEFRLEGIRADIAWPTLGTGRLVWPPRDRSRNDENSGIVGDNLIKVDFAGPAYSEAVGVFVTPEAVGAFGAKKQ